MEQLYFPYSIDLLDFDEQRPFVSVTVIGPERKFDAWALLDTGSEWCLLSEDIAQGIGLQARQEGDKEENLTSLLSPDTRCPAYLRTIEINIGGLRVEDISILVPDGSVWKRPMILGCIGFLNKVDIALLYQEEKLLLSDSS